MRDVEAPLFAAVARRPHAGQPLAERLRPRRLEDVLGQDHLVGPRGVLSATLARGVCPSVVLCGPPGCGKTTLARLLAAAAGAELEELSAVAAGVAEVREVVARARRRRGEHGRATVLFLDEIHRFHRGQQDALLPHVEVGAVALVGATTENAHHALQPALRSRCRVLQLRPLGETALATLLARALDLLAAGAGGGALLPPAARATLMARAGGDARRLLSLLEAAEDARRAAGRAHIDAADIDAAEARRPSDAGAPRGTRTALISAFIKALRASDPDAALYYMVRLLDGGEAPDFVARRMVIFASEDVGNADVGALAVACHAAAAYAQVGMPEGRLALTQACTYLACAAKSNAAARALAAAAELVASHGAAAVPPALCPGARDYRYPPDTAEAADGYHCLPAGVPPAALYAPADSGAERALAARLAAWRRRHRHRPPG